MAAMESPLPRASALIVAAGSSRRMGVDKITAPLGGRPLIHWTLTAFEACEAISQIVVVCAEARLEEIATLTRPFAKVRQIVPGGAERVDSVLHGLRALPPEELVAVHDAARPLITSDLIAQVVAAAAEFGAAVAAEPVTDTLHRADDFEILTETVLRTSLRAMQTPQVAGCREFIAAIVSAKAANLEITDEVSALLRIGIRPRAVLHHGWNFKITHPRDLAMAEALVRLKEKG